MPMKTVQVCSICDSTSAKMHEYTLANAKATLHYDICEECDSASPLVTEFKALGEKRRAVRETPRATAKVTAKKKVGRPRKAPAAETATFSCSECDFTSARAQAVGAHKRHKHGIAAAKA
jgi:hypothetical protein